MEYIGKVFRPPSEARSLIVQCTIGCSHNKCAFCGMYKEDEFRIRPLDDVLRDLEEMSRYGQVYRRIFLADGDALILPMEHLKTLLTKIAELFPKVERVGIYASPKSIATKTVEQLKELKELGLGIAYLGVESGSDLILEKMKKGVSAEELLHQGQKLKDAGIDLSVTLISGLGGKEHTLEHATESAKFISTLQPNYLGLLTLMLEPQTELYQDIQQGRFELLTPTEVLEETRLFVSLVEGKDIVFRSNHASNYLSLGGVLDQEKERILKDIDEAMEDIRYLRHESHRRL